MPEINPSRGLQAAEAIVRPSLSDTERKFFGFAAFSVAVHVFFGWYLNGIDIKNLPPPTLEELPQRIVKLIMDKPKKPEKKAQTAAAQKAEVVKETPSTLPRNEKEKAQARKVAQVQVAKRAQRVQEELRTTGVLALLTGKGPGRGAMRGAVDVLGGQSVRSADLDAALSGLKGVARTVNEDDLKQDLTVKRVVEREEKVSIADLVQGFGKSGKSFEKIGNISVEKPKTVGAATNSSNREEKVITDVVKQNMASIKAAYNRALKQNPALSGKLTVRFTILPNGSVGEADIVESSVNDESFADAVLRRIRNFRFPPIAEAEGNVTVNFPFVFQPE